MQWPKKPATCRRQTVDNKEFLSNSVNSLLVLIYLTVIQDTDIKSKRMDIITNACIPVCVRICTQEKFRNICYQTSLYLCLTKSMRF
jgi:hypothetical protein